MAMEFPRITYSLSASASYGWVTTGEEHTESSRIGIESFRRVFNSSNYEKSIAFCRCPMVIISDAKTVGGNNIP